MELLKTKKRIKLAKKGHKLLKHKRDVLILEFFSVLKEIKEVRINMSDKLSKAQKSLYNAIAIEGMLDIERLSLGLAQNVSIDFSHDKMMGVEVPKLENINISYQWPGYFEQSIELDNAIVKYRKLFPDLIRLAEKQLVLKKLANEIRKTKRRVNSLEFLTIPRLEEIAKKVTFKLEEAERENFSRLKVIKKLKQD
jgi:V/A-type H+-transporting ATPase subunit D